MVSNLQDVTIPFNADNTIVLDTSGWLTATVQFVNGSGTIGFTGTNDGGADQSAVTAQNFTNIQSTNLATGTAGTTGGTGMYKVTLGCKYIKIGGASAAADSVIVFFSKQI